MVGVGRGVDVATGISTGVGSTGSDEHDTRSAIIAIDKNHLIALPPCGCAEPNEVTAGKLRARIMPKMARLAMPCLPGRERKSSESGDYNALMA
ncbi:MAG: hypothetical protein M1343_04930 [Chloroflexi bacterium]|nr:hypothetical protein [Chloroflexota bacterium]MDA8188032.1 hypothetical protein [Dehalococcoidales bacterium]